MTDREGNFIKLSKFPNPNILVWGRSGQGKTYFCYRKIEESVAEGERILILDYSGSYTQQEMERADFQFCSAVREFNLYRAPFYWISPYEDERALVSDIADALVSVLAIRSYRQEKLIHEAVEECFHIYKGVFSITTFFTVIEQLFCTEQMLDTATNDLSGLEKLLSRLAKYKNIKNFHITGGKMKERSSKKLWIIQLSDFPESEKKFLTEFIMTLFWKETLNHQKKFDVVVLDEFQFLRLKAGNAFSGILREGRKYDLSVILSTQFISAFSKQEMESLLQAGNIVIFKPSSNDMRFSAKIVENDNISKWQKLFTGLNVGEAVLRGHYTINEKNNICEKPLVLRI